MGEVAVNVFGFMVQQATIEPLPEPERVHPATSRRNEVLQAIRDHDGITQERLQRVLVISDSMLRRYLRMLVDGGQAHFDGRVWRAA